ncbi:MAG: YfhO family protein [Acutalibacteraceae bacterium]
MIKKRTKFWEENKYIFYAFFATALTMLVVFLCNTMIPFGDKTILRMDLYHQYGPLFAELYERVMHGDGLTYSWISGLGSCFLGNYFNYLSSPIGAIVLFFGHKNVPEAIAAMILIKAALSAATFTYYIKRSLKSQSAVCSAFGVMYALCAYMLAYYWNVMWLDAMVLLPVVLLGIERIINNGKPATYITGLALTMLSNYYMSYMLCVFSVIYFLHYYITNYRRGARIDENYSKKGLRAKLSNSRFFRSGVMFALSSFCAAALMACVLVPVYNILKGSSATSGSFSDDITSYFKYFDFTANHLAGLTTTIRSSGDDVLPNVYCGMLTVILAPLFFFTKSISKKEKVTTLALLTVLYYSFNLNFLNYFWHGLHFPNDLPYRQSFIYSFILLTMAYKTFIRLNEFTSRHFGAVGVGIVAFIFITEKITSKNVNEGTVLISLILVVLYVLILTIFKDKRYQTASVAVMLLICVCSESIMCDSAAMNISVDKTGYVSDYDDFQEIKGTLDTIEQDNFYRMELTNLRTRMDPSWYYYNGVSVFSSMASEKLSNLQDDLGMMSNRINSYTYNPQTPVYNMMFALKYLLNNETPNVLSKKYYTSVAKNDTFEAFENKYYLPIAYCVDSSVEEWANEDYMEKWKIASDSNPFALQGDFFARATGLANPFEKVEITYLTYSNIKPFSESLDGTSFVFQKENTEADGSTTFYLTTETKGNVYLYFDISGSNDKDITINSSIGTITHSAGQECLLDLGRYNVNESISVNIPYDESSGTVKVMAYTLNDEVFQKGYEILSENQFIADTFENTYISGKVTATKDCLLYTSIPYDKGWSVYIDGEKADENTVITVGQSLLGVKLEKGIHKIEFKYSAPGALTGIKISAATVLLLILLAIIHLIKKKSGKKSKRPAYAPIDISFDTNIVIPLKKKPAVRVTEEISRVHIDEVYPEIGKSSVKRELIVPKSTVRREIITPPNTIAQPTAEEKEKGADE